MKRKLLIIGILALLLITMMPMAAAAPPKLQASRLLEPDNGENINLANPCQQLVFNWSKVRLIDHYAFFIDSFDQGDNTWSESVYSEWTYTNSHVIIPNDEGLNEGVLYRWYVAAVDIYHPISWSRTKNNFTFSTTADSCLPP